MMNSESESSSLREDRFELASILRTFQKQQQTLVLAALDDDNQNFTLVRMEGSRIRLLPHGGPLLTSPLTLVAEGSEAKIIFSITNMVIVEQQGQQQWLGELVPTFSYIQRRLNLRVPVPLREAFSIAIHLPGHVELHRFFVDNFSTGGIGLFSRGIPNLAFKQGAIFKKVDLNLGEYGQYKVNVEVISLAPLDEPLVDHPELTHRISMRFLNLSLITQRTFNKIAYTFEVNFNRKR
ncbi:c-di-GMP-binding flagellar brake protein YcgR, contains PilZNR and PilZ domains [Rosenbergiella nectarea]|uniref:C-di-GMP-binding flagellar brake protein YcgR, contains PilZNR and PilZ domains n=1 Tax=Rosenbergiella nectarea TaxID=988801 RepID=A0A1H9DCU6_9GAMM|nr:hypothetical protein [Rosenbergiella nectarea]SEQ11201.1 c-di-GMP-binding flagellar brake protein YcgR, contains PilZNR and PilZ domains [Rosenbergiella nectarea]